MKNMILMLNHVIELIVLMRMNSKLSLYTTNCVFHIKKCTVGRLINGKVINTTIKFTCIYIQA